MRAADVAAKWSITVGGIGTIVAVSMVFLFLFLVAAPLFLPARIHQPVFRPLTNSNGDRLALGLDEFRSMAWWIRSDGILEVRRTDTGELLIQQALVGDAKPTSISTTLGTAEALVGAADGSIRVGAMAFTEHFPEPESVPEELRQKLDAGPPVTWNRGVLQRTPQGQLRHQVLEPKWSAPIQVTHSSIVLLDHLSSGGMDGIGSRELLVAFVTADGEAQFCRLIEQTNAITGETTYEAAAVNLPRRANTTSRPLRVLIAGRGDSVNLAWEDGLLQRFDVRDSSRIGPAEEVQLTQDPTARLTACSFVLGRETLVCGDSQGGLRAWFRVQEQDTGSNRHSLTMVHDLTTGSTAVTALRPSERGRTIAVGYADGSVRMFQVTTERRMLVEQLANSSPVLEVAIAPKEDGLFALTKDRMWSAELEPRHPEATLAALFCPVWYEGYDQPAHTWQSSFATSSPEMKLGLLPLMHGTLKATFYAMLFATPLALLAALYTSEFLNPGVRSVVKPTIEMMASLPSVVLGFLAALVLAVVVEAHVPQLLCVFFSLPFSFLLAAHFWQLIPPRWVVRLQPWRVLFLPVPLICGILAGFWLGPWLERGLFAGNVMRWLDGQIGNGIGAWLLLWLPLCVAGCSGLVAAVVNPWLRSVAGHLGRRRFVLLNLAKFLVATVGVLALAYSISWLMNAVGWDPRGTYVSTYVQRNAFVVGMVMGFAVIPIIYTIADDALSTVPQHLRSASLGCGATPWQTALRVVVPTAMSGLFSAVMIGLGRAVGETMIVLMAGGNTPIMDWNLFDGFRTLAANIAVEMPEAVRDSTHYRTLFLAALTLFLMTFVLNTIAETVRIRFRKRAIQL